MTEKPLVSVVIPAYNKPDYTRKTLKSIIEQTYRPLEVVLSDDGSPETLEPLVREVAHNQVDGFSIRFFRHETNLGPMSNIIFSLYKANGKYIVLMPHDDWFIDSLFLQEAVEIMESNKDCNMCCANSFVESREGAKMNEKLPDHLGAENTWKIVEGDKYIRMLEREIKYQACSAIVCNWGVLKNMGGYQYPFTLSESITEPMGILADEGFVHHFLLSSIGSVAVTNKVVSVRGQPSDSYSQTEAWRDVVGQALFMLMYNVYKADLTGKYSRAVKKRAKEIIFRWPVERINLKIIKHYRYNPEVIYLMLKSHMYYLPRKIKYIQYFRYLKKIVKSGDYKEFKRLFKKFREKIREQGLFNVIKRVLSPF